MSDLRTWAGQNMGVRQKIGHNVKYILFQPYVLLSYYQSKRYYMIKEDGIFSKYLKKSKVRLKIALVSFLVQFGF